MYPCMPANLNQALASLIFSHMHVLSKPFTNCIAWWTNTVENLPDWFCPEMGSNNLRNYFIPANAQPSNHNYFNISIKNCYFLNKKSNLFLFALSGYGGSIPPRVYLTFKRKMAGAKWTDWPVVPPTYMQKKRLRGFVFIHTSTVNFQFYNKW